MLTITPILIRDHYALIAAMMQALQDSENTFIHKMAAWESIAADYMQHVISTQETSDGTCLLAYSDGIPAGFIFGYIEEADESRIEDYTGDTLYISDGYVAPAFRRQGIYRRLNEALEKIYIDKDVRRIVRYTASNNHRMQQFLASQQYESVRIVYEKWLTPDGKEQIKLFTEDDRK
ncbi:GNAT family N-acetyltransferase [Chitinophaga sp. MM2321]|uniref:GNAT family N-acetyltransferase n=1 Tax=Chitinophaga sp. MM2321 TaxID=3137178 RepID=UPI0032D59194